MTNTEVITRAYGVVDLSNVSSGSSRSTGSARSGGGLDSKQSGGASANAATNIGGQSRATEFQIVKRVLWQLLADIFV